MDTAHARELLARERARAERELAGLTDDADGGELSHVDQHLADGGTELFERERDAGLAEQLREELAAIERAEQRLADGSYGRSVESGEPIPDGRLEAVPWAERTVEEQAAHERR
jgi:DnaK suppressor protein